MRYYITVDGRYVSKTSPILLADLKTWATTFNETRKDEVVALLRLSIKDESIQVHELDGIQE